MLLGTRNLGRIAVMDDRFPVVSPISYLLVRVDGAPVVAVRTRPNNSVDHVDTPVGFQIDEFDPGHDGVAAFSCAAHHRAIAPQARLDSHPVVSDQRDAWRIVVPHTVTGRRVIADPDRWPFQPAAYR